LGVLDGVADVPKSGGLDLEALAVLVNRRVTLFQGVKLFKQEDGPGRAVGTEEALNRHPQLAGGLVLVGDGKIKNRVVDGVEDPAADSALGNVPRWISSRRGWSVDVGAKAEFPTQGLEERSPLGEVRILHLQGNRNVSLHVHGGVGVDDDGLRRWWCSSGCGSSSGSSCGRGIGVGKHLATGGGAPREEVGWKEAEVEGPGSN